MSDMNTDIRCDSCDRPAEGVYLLGYYCRYYCRLHGWIVCPICMRWAATHRQVELLDRNDASTGGQESGEVRDASE